MLAATKDLLINTSKTKIDPTRISRTFRASSTTTEITTTLLIEIAIPLGTKKEITYKWIISLNLTNSYRALTKIPGRMFWLRISSRFKELVMVNNNAMNIVLKTTPNWPMGSSKVQIKPQCSNKKMQEKATVPLNFHQDLNGHQVRWVVARTKVTEDQADRIVWHKI